MMSPVRWGVAGTGRVAAHFARDLEDASGAVRAAVSSRDPDRARAFAAEHGFARAHEGVAALAEDAGVDVVYLAGVNTSHYADARGCLERGMPVVVEKPFTMDAREAVLYGERGRIVLPDAFWRPTRVLLHRDGEAPEQVECVPPGRGFAWEAAHVMDCLRAGFTESPIMPLRESVAIMRLLDRLRAVWPRHRPAER